MKLLEEISYDMDFRKPRVVCEENIVILECVETIAMLTEKAVTVKNGKRYVTVSGENFMVREISEGRLTIAGKIQKIEFL